MEYIPFCRYDELQASSLPTFPIRRSLLFFLFFCLAAGSKVSDFIKKEMNYLRQCLLISRYINFSSQVNIQFSGCHTVLVNAVKSRQALRFLVLRLLYIFDFCLISLNCKFYVSLNTIFYILPLNNICNGKRHWRQCCLRLVKLVSRIESQPLPSLTFIAR